VAKDLRVPVRWKIYSIIPYRTSHLNFTPRYLVRRTQVVIMGKKCGVRPILSTNIKKNKTKRLFCFAFGKNLLHLCNETPGEFLLRIFWCVFFIYFLSVSCAWRRLCRRHPLACRWSLSICNFCETFSFFGNSREKLVVCAYNSLIIRGFPPPAKKHPICLETWKIFC
jgi:hypothetical protein